MSMKNRLTIWIACVLLALVVFPTSLLAQTAPATSVNNFPGAGAIIAGDLWECFLPQGAGTPYYGEVSTLATRGIRVFSRMGNYDRTWGTPNAHWPGAFYLQPWWNIDCQVNLFDSDTTWNRGPESANPSFFVAAAPITGANYNVTAQLTYKSTLNGASDATRRYSVEPYFVDGTRRQHVVYECAWPTNLGVDVKFRAHGFAAPNWNNLNDFVIVEVELKNTGYMDMNMDGAADIINSVVQNNHAIKALSFMIQGQQYHSINNYASGGRANDEQPTIYGRQAGWVMDPDPTGAPWAYGQIFSSATSLTPSAGNFDMGFNAAKSKYYTDIHYGYFIVDVKQGGLPTDRAQSTGPQPSKQTIFGTHPIGVGAERGWYASGGQSYWSGSVSNPLYNWYVATSVWYQNVSQLPHNTTWGALNLAPNSNFFASGTAGDPLTFVPKASPTRPNGDTKSMNTFDQIPFEDGKKDATTDYPTGWGKVSQGYGFTENYDCDMYCGVGPVSLAPGETITVVFAHVAGYRVEGMQKSVRAARWAYENNFNVPKPPPLPDMKLSNTLTKSVALEWNNVAETDAEFAGYKIWKSSQFKKVKWLEEGTRIVEQYEQQMTPGARPASVYKPINPKFDAFAKVENNATKGTYQPDTWGTWDLVKTIPKAELGTLAAATSAGYRYKWEDKEVITGFQYWYYISAYKEGTYTGPGGETTTRIETHYTNRNGASGFWYLTYPFAYNNVNYPAADPAKKNMGGRHIVTSALAPKGDVSKVTVKPNPYKRAALFDNRSQVYEHKIVFSNLPPLAKITILDVSGQVIDVINFSSNDPSNGSVFWDMFSKDGIEVASGVYIYVVETPTSSTLGHFAILR